jgi:DNA/RNA-binding domain of Phe-tRNA-synthetase-like protein
MIPLSDELRERFPELGAMDWFLRGVKVCRESPELEEFKDEILARTREKYDLARLKDDEVFRRYRDFFWRIGIDPTKIRPASEALIRRILQGKRLPRINILVDAYNLASIESGIALAAFNADKLKGGPRMRFARPGEDFLGIGMEKVKTLGGGEIVMEDDEKLIAVYPYRDADNTKITLGTVNMVLVACGVPGIGEKHLIRAGELGVEYITRFCGGRISRFEK